MTLLQAEVYEAFRTLDVPDDKALKAAVALSAALVRVEDDTAKNLSKRHADIDIIRRHVQSLKIDSAVMKWMLGILLTMVTAILFKLFMH